MKSKLGVSLVAFVASAIASFLLTPGRAAPSEAATVPIEVGVTATAPFKWTPSGLTVVTGTTVKWTATGPAPHTVTSDGCGNTQYGACVFDSPNIQGTTSTNTFEYTFDKPGIYPFYCRLHGTPGGVGQSGTIVVYDVGKAAPGAPPGDPSKLQPKAVVSISSPAQGETIAGDSVALKLNVSGATLRASQSGITDPAFGHFHVVVDKTLDFFTDPEFPRAGTDPQVFHVADTSFTLSGLTPGRHTVTVFWGFDNHFTPAQPISASVSFTTTAPGTVKPPSTGDAGLADRQGAAGGILAAVLLTGVAVASSAMVLHGRRSR
jgi:plastocyanin